MDVHISDNPIEAYKTGAAILVEALGVEDAGMQESDVFQRSPLAIRDQRTRDLVWLRDGYSPEGSALVHPTGDMLHLPHEVRQFHQIFTASVPEAEQHIEEGRQHRMQREREVIDQFLQEYEKHLRR
ncbi:MAG: hypothetical protein OXR66_03790 [Candidatus Woesearchaeota archaeon]|nr:hypothetical protein [Candidatus Woesearchaeota archaeon]